MPEPVDVYSDQVAVHIGPFGCTLNFSCSTAIPPAAGGGMPGQVVATVRMSLEHLKLMTFMLRRQLLQFEQSSGQVQVPQEVLSQLRIGREDWDQHCGVSRG